MKKSYFIFLLFFGFSVAVGAQQKVHVHVVLRPAHTYVQKMDQMTNTEIEFEVDSADMKQLPGGGKPVKKTSSVHVETETTTGKLFHDSLFSEKLIITSLTNSGVGSGIPEGTTLYGTASTSGRVTMDSLSSDSMDAELKEKLFPVLQKLFKQLAIPERTVKAGESFSQKVPLSFPIPGMGMNLDFVINTTYKLKSISNSIAYFDLVLTYEMSSESVSLPIKADGTGSGTMLYDINNEYFLRYEMNSVMNMRMSIEQKTMKIKAESTVIQQAKISAH